MYVLKKLKTEYKKIFEKKLKTITSQPFEIFVCIRYQRGVFNEFEKKYKKNESLFT